MVLLTRCLPSRAQGPLLCSHALHALARPLVEHLPDTRFKYDRLAYYRHSHNANQVTSNNASALPSPDSGLLVFPRTLSGCIVVLLA